MAYSAYVVEGDTLQKAPVGAIAPKNELARVKKN